MLVLIQPAENNAENYHKNFYDLNQQLCDFVYDLLDF